MFVKDYMTRHPIMISPETGATEAQKILAENKVRHLPVVGDGKRLKGLITRQRLSLKPDALGSLSVWEISRYLATLAVKDVMLKAEHVQCIDADQTIERAAKTMAEHKIGCLPVLDEDNIVIGILTEVDVFGGLQDLLGLAAEGVRVTMRMPNREGEFAKLTSAIAAQGWGVMGIGSYPSPRREGFYNIVLKIPGVAEAEVKRVLSQVAGQEVLDVRSAV
jgi:acetoin utilization protein AcuB